MNRSVDEFYFTDLVFDGARHEYYGAQSAQYINSVVDSSTILLQSNIDAKFIHTSLTGSNIQGTAGSYADIISSIAAVMSVGVVTKAAQ